MTKAISLTLATMLAAVALFAIATLAHADVLCPDPGHKVATADGAHIVGCISDADWQRAAAEAYTRSQPASIYAFGVGQSVTLKNGRIETCPFWFPMAGCVISRDLLQ